MVLMVFVLLEPGFSEKDTADFADEGVLFLEQYCYSCHSGDQPEAALSLDAIEDNVALLKNHDVIERVLDMLRTHQMPPEGSDHPPAEEVEAFFQHVEAALEEASRHAKPDPGHITVRRLNRVEYKNSVRDLLGADFDPTENFPADDVGHGFDNIGDVLTMSPLLMERYLEAAEAIATRVITLNPPKPARHYQKVTRLDPRNKDVPDKRFRILDPTATEPWKSGPFTTGAAYFKFLPDAETYLRATLYSETESDTPVEVALLIQGKELEDVSTPDELTRLVGVDPAANSTIKILKIFEITARDPKKTQTVEFLVSRVANVEKVGIAMVKPAQGEPNAKLQIRAVWSEGPLETRPKSHLKILTCTPDIPQIEQTREVLTRLLRKAYRRPPTENEVEQLAQYVESVQADGAKWEAGIQQAIKIILCSPKFLFRLELDDSPQTDEPQPIDEWHLASRLSFFLWSSIPDDTLLELAEKNQLTESLDAQVQRMLSDPKASELASNFGTQWLQIQRLGTVTPDPERFPSFSNKLRASMLKETELFLESIFREDRSIIDILDADYTFLNQRLTGHYGIWRNDQGEVIKGEAFQRVAIKNRIRGGILTHASVLTVTSNPTRTSPVKRGVGFLSSYLVHRRHLHRQMFLN